MPRYQQEGDEFDLGFQLAEAGQYVAQIQEGIKCQVNEKSGKTSIHIPFKLVEVYSKNGSGGSEDSVNAPFTHFVPIESEWGERQICQLLTITDLAASFEKNIPDGTAYTDPKFVDALKLKLPDKLVGLEIMHQKDQMGEVRARLKKWFRYGKKPTQAQLEAKTNPEPPMVQTTPVEDW